MSTKHFIFTAAIVLAFAGMGLIPSAQAEDEHFCKDYARDAVEQAKDAEHHERCHEATHRDESRWSRDFKHHFDWCRGAKRSEADRERDERRHTLEHCSR